MKIQLKKTRSIPVQADLLSIPMIAADECSDFADERSWHGALKPTSDAVEEINTSLDGALKRAVRRLRYKPARGKRVDIAREDSGKALRLCGMSVRALVSAGIDEWRELGGDTSRRAKALGAKAATVVLPTLPSKIRSDAVQAIAEGALLAEYQFTRYKNSSQSTLPGIELTIGAKAAISDDAKRAVKKAERVAKAVTLARDLVNTPPSDLPPAELAKTARKIANTNKAMTCRVHGKAALEKLGANALLAVSRGSSEPPCLIHLSYKPQGTTKSRRKIVLVGKGVTFDSGGLSIKSGSGMEDMKDDMGGAAAVLGTMHYLSKTSGKDAPQHEVHALIPATENMINGNSVKPGDVVRAINKKTIEILNTDAEGRLILADALSYSARLKPEIIIDVATLTGAVVAALGQQYAGLFCNDEALSEELLACGRTAGERFWPMPLAEEYRSRLNSNVAEIKNTGGPGAGAITAALFLREFVPPDIPWAHLDIAGTCFAKSAGSYSQAGASGFGVRTLIAFLDGLQ